MTQPLCVYDWGGSRRITQNQLAIRREQFQDFGGNPDFFRELGCASQ